MDSPVGPVPPKTMTVGRVDMAYVFKISTREKVKVFSGKYHIEALTYLSEGNETLTKPQDTLTGRKRFNVLHGS